MELVENMMEFISGSRTATVTFSNQKHINRIKKLYKERPDEFKYFHQNKDGSIVAKLPLKWLKINPGAKVDPDKPKRIVSEEHKERMRAALAEYRNSKNR
ncbi:hypothetical protein [Kineothrix sedimenti]|uniref:Uncharacterized protein n=1 Tax=Kineothrix sedimenti TaxID=3123317 RepID=A0ABZ3F212_9FIRM